jgi:hypothetical protein
MRRVGLAVVVLVAACHRGSPSQSVDSKPTPAANGAVTVAVGKGRRTEAAAKTHETISIPAGKFVAGSMPGDEGRDPGIEPIATTYELPAFTIDALPYPNEPGVAPTTAISEAEAARLCTARGERLCTELEWERACRGPGGEAFASGPGWDPTCAEAGGAACVSGFGVRMLGGTIEEWTANVVDVGTPEKKAIRAIVRGAYPSAPPAAHRCAARHALDGHVSSALVGFRCCNGGAPDATMSAIADHPTFRKASIAPSKLAEVLASIPELARVKVSPHLFRETEIVTVFEKAKAPPAGATVTVDPVLWSPSPGEEILVVAGRSKGGAFVVALHALPDDRYRLASSLIFSNEQGPIVLAYQSNIRKEITWSMCWGCAGEGGAVTYRDDHRVVIVQR